MSKLKGKLDLMSKKSYDNQPFSASEIAEKNAEINSQECVDRPAKLKSTPARVRLDLTNICNLTCTFCYRAHFKSDDRSLLKPQDIDRLDPILRNAKYVALSQKTESLLSPHVVPILEKLQKYNAIFSMNTNAQVITEEIAEALIRTPVTFLPISISAFNEEAYQRIYKGGKLEPVLENLRRLNKLKKKHGSLLPRMRVSFVLRMDTIDYLDDALEFVKEYEFSEGIQIILFERISESDRQYEPVANWDYCYPIIEKFRKKAESQGVLINTSYELPEELSGYQDAATYSCHEPWESFNLNPNGDVMPCTTATIPMGNIHEEDPLTIWNNRTYRNFRERMDKPPYNNDCSNCWNCQYVSPFVTGERAVKFETIFGNYYRRRPNRHKKAS